MFIHRSREQVLQAWHRVRENGTQGAKSSKLGHSWISSCWSELPQPQWEPSQNWEAPHGCGQELLWKSCWHCTRSWRGDPGPRRSPVLRSGGRPGKGISFVFRGSSSVFGVLLLVCHGVEMQGVESFSFPLPHLQGLRHTGRALARGRWRLENSSHSPLPSPPIPGK